MVDIHHIPELDRAGLRRFGLVTGIIFGALFGGLFPWLADKGFVLWPWVVTGVLWVWALALPGTLKPVYHGWMWIGLRIGWVNTRLILLIVFYFVILPFGVVMRWVFRKDPMSRGLDPEQETYRVQSTPSDRERMERPY